MQGLQYAQGFEKLSADPAHARIAFALQAAATGLGQHDGQRRLNLLALQHQFGHQGHTEDGTRLRKWMIAPATVNHILQVNATVNVQGDCIGGVMQQRLSLGQVESLDFGTVDVWLDILQGSCKRRQLVARTIQWPIRQRHFETVF